MPSKTDFVHLHVHTEYSMLDGLSKIPKLVAKAKQHNQRAIAITDHGGMYGCLHFFNECKKQGIQPIIGVEAYMAKNSRHDKQSKMGADQFHITLLAQNLKGYQNLMHLVSKANFEGFSYKPRIDFEILNEFSEGVIATSGCMGSLVNKALLKDNEAEAKELLGKFTEIFPKRFYIELQEHPAIKELAPLNTKLISLARSFDLPIIATNDVHYVEKTEAPAQDALICVQTRKLLSDKKRMSMMNSPDFYLRSSEEMAELFSGYPEALKNTVAIAEQCNFDIPTGELIFPKFPLPKGESDVSLLKKLTYEGLKKKIPNAKKVHTDRIEYEIGVIAEKGYSTYFLITEDFVRWAKDQGIGVGPGRGSAAGSLVSFCLDITTINPLTHGLTFERFLNPQRPTPPDVDIDFADDRRDEVIEYCSQKYGTDQVAHVITFGKMEARVSIRDIGRVLGMPYEDPDKIAKLIPNNPAQKTSIVEARTKVPDLAQYYKQPKFKKLMDLASQVEGTIRHNSVHAAAVIITDKPMPFYTPIQLDQKSGRAITQYDMYALDCNVQDDAIGLLKFDFLGLRNLSTIQTALQLIKEQHDKDIDIRTIPIDDTKTFELLSRGDTVGVFQLESAGMKRVARSLKPTQFSDITAMVALYRPGPMELIPTFIAGKHEPDKIQYPHESLKPILEESYGVMVYQEQILLIANVMGGYSLSEADILRKAIGKKKKSLLDKNKKRFISQSIKNKYKKEVAEKVWGFIEAFANYGFNKAHATSYAMIAYQTAWLKANYPIEYMTALMSVESASHNQHRDVRVAQAIEESKKMGIHVLPPDINHSDSSFSVEKKIESMEGKAIRFGLNAIKNVGSKAIENIIETRATVPQNKFTSVTQFIQETDGRKANKKVLESLIMVGAFDAFATRATLLENLEAIKNKAVKFYSDVEGQDHLFANLKQDTSAVRDDFAEIPEYPKPELLSFEKKLLGMYLTEHPLAGSLKLVKKLANKQLEDLDESLHQGKVFLFGGVLTQLREVTTKKSGKQMAFGTLEDESGKADLVIFPRTFETYQKLLEVDTVILVKGKVEYRDGELSILADKILSPGERKRPTEVTADVEIFIPRKTSKETLEKVGKLLKASKGSSTVHVLIPNGTQPKRMQLPYTVEWSKKLQGEVDSLLND